MMPSGEFLFCSAVYRSVLNFPVFMEFPGTPSPPGPINGAPPRPGNWLIPAVLVTIFCCNVLGVIGIVYAARVDTKYQHGDYAGAAEDARQARLWTLIPLAIGLVLFTLLALFYGTLFITMMRSSGQYGQ